MKKLLGLLIALVLFALPLMAPAPAEAVCLPGGPCEECFDCVPIEVFWTGETLNIYWDCDCGPVEVYRHTWDGPGESGEMCSPH